MKKLIVSCATVLIVCIQIVCMQTVPAHASVAEVEAFVTRFYQECLNRQPDQQGLDYWTNSLLAGILTGADVANGFVFSTEFTSLNTSNEDYLTVLYFAFFDRDPDSAGYNYWMSQLNSGVSRQDVLDGFIYAQEFYNLCYNYGISANLVSAFVQRFYLQCLSRLPDLDGLSYWVNALFAGSQTGADVAAGFVFSPEFTSLNTSNADYLTVLYLAFFDRDPDSAGYNYWMSQLNSGVSREDALCGFINSAEFANLCNNYGINPGSCAPPACDNIAGQWFVTETDDLRGCELPVESYDFYMTITQTGCDVTFIDFFDTGASSPMTIVGNQMSYFEQFPELGGTVTGTWNFTISGNGTVLNGSVNWTWTDGVDTCFASSTMTGTLVP